MSSLSFESEKPHIGAELSAARQAAGLSLQDTATQLHIQAKFLDAIERLDKEPLPSLGYVLGYVRTYSRFLGIDENYAIAQFKTNIEAPKNFGVSGRPHHVPKRSLQLPKGSAAIGAVLACVLVVGSWYGMQSDAKSAPVMPVSAKAAPAAQTGADTATASQENWGFKPVEPTKDNPNIISLKAIGPSWVQVVGADGTVLMSRIMVPGEIFETNRESEPVLSLRDAGAIELYVGGARIGLIGARGASAKNIALATIAAQ